MPSMLLDTVVDDDGDGVATFGDAIEVMLFDLAGSPMACDISYIDEVLKEFKMTRVPNVEDPSITGVINLRGHILPVMDLAVKIKGYEPGTIDAEGKAILVTRLAGAKCGILVDSVKNITAVTRSDLSSKAALPTAVVSRAHVSGVFTVPETGDITMLLDVPSIVDR